jgi:uncharacterized membrane protein HdeD (DUF308 family)
MSTSPGAVPRSLSGRVSDISLPQLYIGRATLALVWVAAFVAVDAHLTTGTKLLLVVYPAIDVIASLIDARSQRRLGSGSVQLVNAALSTVALIALILAVGSDRATVLHVFGTWATVSGLIQLAVATRRRPYVGRQTAMLVSGGLSTLAGITFNIMATSSDPKLSNLAGYAGIGALLFIFSAFRLRR